MPKILLSLRAVLAIARVTFSEIVRDRVLYGALIICGLLLVLGGLASRLSFVRPERVLLDFGLFGMALSGAFLGILAGAVVIAREFDRRTVFLALARPISRLEFLLGKYVGVAVVLVLNSLLLSAGFLFVLRLLPGGDALLGPTVFQALGLLALQSLVLAALSLFFSSFSTPSLSIVMALGMYLVGVNLSQLRLLAAKQEAGALKYLIEGFSAILPNFEHFNLGLKVSYGLAVPGSFVLASVAYALVWIGLLLVFAGVLLDRKES
jgi:ABC-type transport system involved in multi-copper enzyme maturation permease subunit